MSSIGCSCRPFRILGDPSLTPAEYQSEVRMSEAHLGVRFGDTGPVTVLLDGVDVTNQAVELVAGDAAWVELQRQDADGKPVQVIRAPRPTPGGTE